MLQLNEQLPRSPERLASRHVETTDIVSLRPSGVPLRETVSLLLLEELGANPPQTEREIRQADILASYVGVSPALAGVLEYGADREAVERTVYVRLPSRII